MGFLDDGGSVVADHAKSDTNHEIEQEARIKPSCSWALNFIDHFCFRSCEMAQQAVNLRVE